MNHELGAARHPGSSGGAVFAAMEERFGAAVRAVGAELVRDHRVAGTAVRVRLAGEALCAPLLPAMGHLAHPVGDRPDLEILVFDTASTGVEPPPPPDGADGEPGVLRVLQRGAGLFSILDAERRRAVVWTADAARVPANEVAAPLRMVLQSYFAAHGTQLVHAAAVGTPAAAVLIGGRSGAGKSTTALACVEAGLGYAGDDYVLARGGGRPRVWSLYASAKLLEPQLERFPDWLPAVVNRRREPDEKPVLLVHELLRGRLLLEAPLRAVVVPRVSGTTRPRLCAISAGEALAALAPSTLFQLPFDRAGALARLRGVVAACPCYRLDAGPDLAAVAAAVRGLVDAHA